MADAADDVRASLEKQIVDLKTEVARLGKALSARAADAMEDAGDALEEGKGRARRTVAQVRDQANAAAHTMRANPGTTATVLPTIGLLGLAAGFLLGGIGSGLRRR